MPVLVKYKCGEVVMFEPDATSVGESSTKSFQLGKTKKEGLSMYIAAVFLAGEMAGSGILALPHALCKSGWSGVALLFVCCCNALFSGICLGKCWLILEERWAEYREKSRNPYPTIASRAVGPWMGVVVSVCIDITLFGVATVFLLISAQLVGNMAKSAGLYSCYWILILGAVLCPLMWLGTPDDFWPAAIFALSTTLTAAILLVVAILRDIPEFPDKKYSSPTAERFSLAFATILFAFGGAAIFPTIQNDMKNKHKFPKAASIAFVLLILMYVPVAVSGYAVYGDSAENNILDSIVVSKGPLTMTIQILLAMHLFFAFLLAINAPSQEIEEFFNIPRRFSWKRCVIRSTMMGFIVFIALSIPKFGKVLDLVGGSTVTLMTFVFPPIFYMMLARQKKPDWPDRTIPLYQRIYLFVIMAIGIVGGSISTYSAISSIVEESAFAPPCYINMTATDMQPHNNTAHFASSLEQLM